MYVTYILPDSQRALCIFGEDDGESFELADIATHSVLKNTLQEATRCASGCHRLAHN